MLLGAIVQSTPCTTRNGFKRIRKVFVYRVVFFSRLLCGFVQPCANDFHSSVAVQFKFSLFNLLPYVRVINLVQKKAAQCEHMDKLTAAGTLPIGMGRLVWNATIILLLLPLSDEQTQTRGYTYEAHTP